MTPTHAEGLLALADACENAEGARERQILLSAFGQGQACARRDGYRSDNPHEYESAIWQAWLAGFDEEEGPRYTRARAASGEK